MNATSIENYTRDACRTESLAEPGRVLAEATAIRMMIKVIAQNGKIIDQLKRRVFYKRDGVQRACGAVPEDSRLIEVSRLIHGLFTLATEAGEIAECLDEFIEDDIELDFLHIGEEIGDSSWGLAILAAASGLTLEECQHRNIAKLKRRYPNGWTQDAALNRDLAAERTALEGEQNGQL